ncbi:helix-turn-helix domain-containing protein [Streptomyces sioyaensis]|uniref:helix-turn-helix domain-containing protein n=1 Tax=Streptomyces sioyaensis TaxID=67364 RepID=UPI0036565EA1
MPRRPTHLSPEDGPVARFALSLRALRDEAGFDAATVDSIAAKTNIPRSTLYAALRGQRIPTRPVLEAMVSAWKGDAVEWLKKRSETEAEIEASRGQRNPTSPRRLVSPRKPAGFVPDSEDQEETPLSRFAKDLQELRLRAGQPSVRQIARTIQHDHLSPAWVSHTTVAEMFRGRHLPQWKTLEGVVRALQGDPEQWKERWVGLRGELGKV